MKIYPFFFQNARNAVSDNLISSYSSPRTFRLSHRPYWSVPWLDRIPREKVLATGLLNNNFSLHYLYKTLHKILLLLFSDIFNYWPKIYVLRNSKRAACSHCATIARGCWARKKGNTLWNSWNTGHALLWNSPWYKHLHYIFKYHSIQSVNLLLTPSVPI